MIYIICFLIKKFLKKPYTSFLRDFSTFYFLNPELSIVCWQCPALSIQMTFIFSNNISYLIGYYLICIWSVSDLKMLKILIIWSVSDLKVFLISEHHYSGHNSRTRRRRRCSPQLLTSSNTWQLAWGRGHNVRC